MKDFFFRYVLPLEFFRIAIVFMLLLPFTVRGAIGDTGPSGIGDTGEGGVGDPGGLQNPLRFETLDRFFVELLDVLVQVAFPLVVLAVIYTGFLFVTARGDREQLEKAKKAFAWTVVGALIVLGAAAIAELVGGTVAEIRG